MFLIAIIAASLIIFILYEVYIRAKVKREDPRNPRLTIEQEGGLWCHEDDFGQIEIVPSENLAYLREEVMKVEAFSREHFNGAGYTAIYLRNEPPLKLSERKIKADELEFVLKDIGFARAQYVTLDITYRTRAKDVVGYGKGYSAIYFSQKESVVNSIWLTNPFGFDEERVIVCLNEIGTRWNLVLVDWNHLDVVDMNDSDTIKNYLNG